MASIEIPIKLTQIPHYTRDVHEILEFAVIAPKTITELAKELGCAASEIRRALGFLMGEGQVTPRVMAGNEIAWRLTSAEERESL